MTTTVLEKDAQVLEKRCRWSKAFADCKCVSCSDEISSGDRIVIAYLPSGKMALYCDVCGLEMMEISKKNNRFHPEEKELVKKPFQRPNMKFRKPRFENIRTPRPLPLNQGTGLEFLKQKRFSQTNSARLGKS